MKKNIIAAFASASLIGCIVIAGCRAKASIATWQPPGLSNGQIQVIPQTRCVAFAPILGPDEIKNRLEAAINNSVPKGSQHLAVIYPADGPQLAGQENLNRPFKTASFQKDGSRIRGEGQLPEMTPLDAARNRNAGLIVQGSIELADIEGNKDAGKISSANPNNPGAALAALNRLSNVSNKKDERIIVTWEAFDVATGQFVNASTVSFTRSQAEKEYPDLVMLADPVDRLLVGVSRETWSQYAPSVERKEVTLNRPYWSLGSKRVREGNAFAEEGLWQMAEQQWQAAVTSHPRNKSAWHNLAIASVAQEDFEMARLRLSKAKGWIPDSQIEKTELWIDAQQKAYHRAFGLPDREGGWLNPDPPMAPLTRSETTDVVAKDIDDMPWWTAIPFTKPPGWTWRQWLTQPLP